MAYGSPPPAPGPGRQPGYGGQAPWQQQPSPGPYGPGPQAPPPGPPGPYGPGPGPGPGQYGPPPQPPAHGLGGPTRQAPTGPPSPQEQNWALMAYLGQFLTSAIAPAVVLVTKGGSPFVRRHAVQGLNIAIGAIVVWVVGILLTQLMDALALIPLAYTAAVMYFLVRAAITVNRGEFLRVPAFIAWPLLK
ncbi:Uncharacterized conserved protein, Tic20 family [Thermomonospora echinospora]|uniref:Uncharacterized conserved protein, Tic20 family n=1 Tax=Thermomonospora echinospora TaxID=1992 RepID=A0A1H6BJ54_9ACTN|nr:DUF4870 domain-containing protein [Thermomonospora echinospora]SEG60791.1 Uncharacterized conserved protein, Tic20 family [Thermomonospora echinospora]